MKYTITDLQADFPDDDAVLEWLVGYLYPEGITCKLCGRVTKHYRDNGRRSYSCGVCGRHMHPTVGTVFHNTRIPLTIWLYAMFLMSNSKAGMSAAQVQRQTGVSYNAAWRMMHKIRGLMADKGGLLSGEVEIDETYVHPNVYKRSSAQRRYGRTGNRTGQILFGIVQRGGAVKIWHVKSAGARVLQPLIREHVAQSTLIHTDGYLAYRRLPKMGYEHRWTDHSKWEFYTEDSYTQNIENVWSHLKRGLKGVYRHVEPKYLQKYADEFAWRYSHRNDVSMFWALALRVSQPS